MCSRIAPTIPKARWKGTALLLAVLLPAALTLRLYGINWDQGFLFHPDERQILMVTERLAWPRNWPEFLSPQSPLNPRFFAYGSLPIYLLRLLSWLLARLDAGWASLWRFYQLGRLLSALFDTATLCALYALARRLYDRRVAALTAVLAAFTVLHIQLAHFFTVDTLLTMLVVLAVLKALDVERAGRARDGAWLAVLLGAALATKVSALPLVAVVVAAWLAFAWPTPGDLGARLPGSEAQRKPLSHAVHVGYPGNDSVAAVSAWLVLLRALGLAWRGARRGVCLSLGVALLVFLLLQPYALLDAARFARGVGLELSMSQGWTDVPYTRQYAGTLPYLYQVRQLLLFGMGLPLGLLGLAGLFYLVWRTWRRPSRQSVVWLTWPLLYALQQGAAYAKFLRYALPLLPFLCMAGAALAWALWDRSAQLTTPWRRRVLRWGAGSVLVLVPFATLLYALAFARIYAQPHPWLQASAWLCEHVPAGATLMADVWDDALPVYSTTGAAGCAQEYSHFAVDLHGAESSAKREQMLDGLLACDYIVLPSDRLYASLTRLPERFPLASRYYQQLFAERLGFRLVAAPAVHPNLAGVTLRDDPRAGLPLPIPRVLAESRPAGRVIDLGRADESFTVYDHPQPLIFQRFERLSREELQHRLQGGS